MHRALNLALRIVGLLSWQPTPAWGGASLPSNPTPLALAEAPTFNAGFTDFALMATLPGKRLYEVCGYVGDQSIEHPLPGGSSITFVPMTKRLKKR